MYHWRGNVLLMHPWSSAVGSLSLLSALLFPLTPAPFSLQSTSPTSHCSWAADASDPVQMLANSMSRSYETVLAAVKDTEGTLLQLQLPLVNGWVKKNHLERKWKQQADCQGEMWGQRRRGGGVLYPRQNAIETAGRERASGTLLSSSKAWLCGCSRSQWTALLIVWLFVISAHCRLRVELPKYSIFTFWNILLIPEPQILEILEFWKWKRTIQ